MTTPAPPADASLTPPSLGPPAELARASNRFALELWARAGEGNVALSPASIATALTIAWGGAKGETAAQMQKVLHLEGEPDAILSRWGELSVALQDKSRALTLRLANRLYGEHSYSFDTVYFTIIRKAFDVWIEPVDFATNPEGTRDKINTWVAEQTEQRIKDLLPPRTFDADTRLVIVNAIYFLADWARAFDVAATRPRDFFVRGKTAKQVPTMLQTGAFRYASDPHAALLELPYRGESAAMFIVLPAKRDGLAAVEASLAATLASLQPRLVEQTVSVALPRFTIDPPAPLRLADELKALGMIDAFDPAKADFTNIAKPKTEQDRLFVSDVLHEAFVKVDERGTEAAAATAIVTPRGGPPRQITEFRAEHPFVFVIVDRTTGMILFIGRVVDPR